jgi:antitoxin component YwqK of YwqJK toxin-antitoxin module
MLERRVMRRHTNGKEHVVLYFKTDTGDLVKEEVFFETGRMQWSGGYKASRENGPWQFFWENGRVKTVENYVDGKEHGTSSEFDQEGNKIKDSFWKNGRLLKEVKY